MNKDEALKLALEALEAIYYGTDIGPRVQYAAITAIQEALAQPEHMEDNLTMVQPAHLVTKEVSLPEQDWEGIAADQAMTIALLKSEQEPLEYWNAVEGWVKIDEVRKHFDSVGCGTIYKTAGEGRAPLYTSPPAREWVGLNWGDLPEEWVGDTKFLTGARWAEEILEKKNA